MVGGQKIQVKTVAVTVGPDTYEVTVEPGITVTAPEQGVAPLVAAFGLLQRLLSGA
jgi:hypothetical protein